VHESLIQAKNLVVHDILVRAAKSGRSNIYKSELVGVASPVTANFAFIVGFGACATLCNKQSKLFDVSAML
jgi:hypothetical protein